MVEIRLLSAADAVAFADHLERNLATSGVANTPTFFARSRFTPFNRQAIQKWQDVWQRPVGQPGWERVWGAFNKGAGGESIVGAVSLQTLRYLDSQPHRAVLGMGIENGFRGAGLGRRLMNTCIEWAVQQPFLTWVDLGVFAHNQPARRLYERTGFIEIGRTVDCFRIDGHSVDDIQMTLDLRALR